ncbi:MAG: DUF6489 family protein [Alphaproteobacteria bacterium]
MKFTIEIDADPEEARRFLGMPNIEPMQERLLDQLEEQIARNMKAMDPEALMKAALPLTVQGIEQVQGMLSGLLRGGRKTKDSGEGEA